MRLISPAAGWKDVKSEVQALYFLMSNPPRKVNTTGTTRFGCKGHRGRAAYTVVYNALQLPQAGSHTCTGRRHPEVARMPRVRPTAMISLTINKAGHVSIRERNVAREFQGPGVMLASLDYFNLPER